LVHACCAFIATIARLLMRNRRHQCHAARQAFDKCFMPRKGPAAITTLRLNSHVNGVYQKSAAQLHLGSFEPVKIASKMAHS
jgi:hypothetical protein